MYNISLITMESFINIIFQARIQGGGAFGACAPPPLTLMPNEKIYGD